MEMVALDSITPFMTPFTLEATMTYQRRAGDNSEAIEVGQDDNLIATINGKRCKILPYQPGAASYVTSTEEGGEELGVLSGNFSGCIMGKIGKRVYHVATTFEGDSSPDCKALWHTLKGSHSGPQKIIEFKPTEFVGVISPGAFPPNFPAHAQLQVVQETNKEMVFGLITSHNEAFAIRAKGERSGAGIKFTPMKIIPVRGAW